jgi:AmmeMemoRadiSam system protein A
VFVTLRTRNEALRGCVGHLEPGHGTLAQEVATCAVACATRDSRFWPVCADELCDLVIEISVLSEPVPVASIESLDPSRYGVVVSCGRRRGVLLPNVDGVHSARDQVRLAASKAGIAPEADGILLERFEVIKLREQAAGSAAEPLAPRTKSRHELN